jgi:hypothetical protein
MTDEEKKIVHERARERALELVKACGDADDCGVYEDVLTFAYAHAGALVSVLQNTKYSTEERYLMLQGDAEICKLAREEILGWLRSEGKAIESS